MKILNQERKKNIYKVNYFYKFTCVFIIIFIYLFVFKKAYEIFVIANIPNIRRKL